MTNILDQIQETISSNDVVVYMKGTKDFPQCGFSAVVVQMLKNLNVNFLDVNVLADPEVRQGVKDFSDWPTVPQIYVKGEFIGGCDIMKEMFQSGELQDLLKEKGIL
jgi:monothiol glutaredoxin